MRQIKFRGRDIKTGEWVYGDLQTNHRTDGSLQFGIRSWEKLDDWIEVAPNRKVLVAEYYLHQVEPDSVAQFVGHDINGKEVYEGDILTNRNGWEHTTRIESVHQDELGRFSFWEYPSQLTLKETTS